MATTKKTTASKKEVKAKKTTAAPKTKVKAKTSKSAKKPTSKPVKKTLPEHVYNDFLAKLQDIESRIDSLEKK